jgi:hypothetical protein
MPGSSLVKVDHYSRRLFRTVAQDHEYPVFPGDLEECLQVHPANDIEVRGTLCDEYCRVQQSTIVIPKPPVPISLKGVGKALPVSSMAMMDPIQIFPVLGRDLVGGQEIGIISLESAKGIPLDAGIKTKPPTGSQDMPR